MAAIAHVNIQGRVYEAVPNPSLRNEDGTPKSALDHVVKFNGTANGAFRCLQLLDRTSRAAVVVLKDRGSDMAAFFEAFSGKLSLSWAMLAIPRLPEVTKKAKEALVGSVNSTNERLHDLCEAAATWCYASSLVAGNVAMKQTGDVFDLGSSATDLNAAARDWSLSKRHLEMIDVNDPTMVPLQQLFVDKMRHSLIKLAKAISSVVNGVVGLIALSLGIAFFSPTTALLFSSISTVAAVGAHFFGETRQYKLPDFSRIQNPQVYVGARVAG